MSQGKRTAPRASRKDEQIEGWAQSQDVMSVTKVLSSCLHSPKAQWTQADKKRVALSLQSSFILYPLPQAGSLG